MPEPSLRDRFFTPRVARAVTSPLGILAAGAGAAVGIAAGLPIVAAAGIGAAAYAVRVAAAVPRREEKDGVNPFTLSDPWRTFVWQAQKAQRQFDQAAKRTKDGPLRERLVEIGTRIADGVTECTRIAVGGQTMTEARAQIDVTAITRELSALPPGPESGAPAPPPPPGTTDGDATTQAQTAAALQSQLDTAKRMDQVIASTRDRLRLLDAQLGEAVTRAIELSVRPEASSDVAALGADVDSLVHELESLRVALDETDRT